MHVRFAFALLLAATAAAQPASETTPPTPREKARELLDRAAQMSGTAQPNIHVMALMDLGDAYQVFDKGKSAIFLRDAFAATSAVGEDDGLNFRTRFQQEIVKKLARISVNDACDMLRAMAEPGKDAGGGSATRRVVDALLAQNEPRFDRAIEMVNLVPDTAVYAFDAAEQIFLRLPAGDSRRTIVFGNALSAYRRHPEGTTFPHMLGRVWRSLPRESAQTAVAAVVTAISDRADDPNNREAGFSANEEGTKRNNSRKAKELLELIHVVRELDPKRASELLEKYPEIADAPKPSEEAPKAEAAEGSNPSSSPFAMPLVPFHVSANPAQMNLEEIAKEAKNFGAMMEKMEAATDALEKDNDAKKALAVAAELDPRFRASMLATAAESVSGKNPELGQRLVNECTGLLGDLKDPGDRALAWAKIAGAAHKLKNEKLESEAFAHALDDLIAVWASDTNPDMPNVALPEQWPSIQGCRMLMWSATKSLGLGAEPLLAGIRNPDLTLLAHIEMGRVLLDLPRHEMSIAVQYNSK